MNSSVKGHIALIVSGIMFGANYWIAKSIMPAFTPFQIVAFRVFIVTGLFWIIGLFEKNSTKISRKDMLIIFVGGVLGITINQYFFFAGLEHSSPVETSILHTLSPLLVALFAVRILNEKPGMRKMTGIFLGFIGAFIIIISGKSVDFSNLHFVGNMFIIINIISYSLYLVIMKPVMNRYKSIQVLKYLFLAGSITYLPFSGLNEWDISFSHVSLTEWLSLAYVVFVTTLLTYLLTLYAIKRLSATTTGFYIYMQPFIAALIGYMTGFEKLNAVTIFASVFLFTGVWLVVSRRRPHRKEVIPLNEKGF